MDIKILLVKSLAVFGLTLGLLGCGQKSQPIQRMDAYFQPFLPTPIVRKTESSMRSSALNELHTQDQSVISKTISAISINCKKSPRNEDDMDLRVLIYFSSSAGKRTWKASNFDYFDSEIGKVCIISESTKSSIEKILMPPGHT